MPQIFIPVLFVLIVSVGWLITTYNRFIKYRNKIEKDIQNARNRYNNYVSRLNTLVESFPAVFIAKKYGFEKRSYFSLDLATQREVPEVDFSPPGNAPK